MLFLLGGYFMRCPDCMYYVQKRSSTPEKLQFSSPKTGAMKIDSYFTSGLKPLLNRSSAYIPARKGQDIDQPQNLAKSVTVE